MTIDTTGRVSIRGAFGVSNGDGSSGQVLQSQGIGVAPIWTNVASLMPLTTNLLSFATSTGVLSSTVNGVLSTSSLASLINTPTTNTDRKSVV